MVKLTPQERERLMRVIEGKSRGSYVGALTMLNLAEARTPEFVAQASFCSLEEIRRVEKAFENGGIEAAIEFKP